MRDWDLYYNRMGKNISEKADFILRELETGDYDTVIDYGCADGRLMEYLTVYAGGKTKGIEFCGVDFEKVIDRVLKERGAEWPLNEQTFYTVEQFENLGEGLNYIVNKRTLVIFSSVIHEMGTAKFLNLFENYFKKAGAIAIRDMRGAFKDVSSYAKAQELIVKSLYPEHYEEEMAERYFSVDWGLIELVMFSDARFRMIYMDYYANDYLMENVKGLDEYTSKTHCKVIYKRLDNER